MAYEIYTFGNGEVLSGVFNSIAMCMNGDTVLSERLCK